MSSNNSWEDPPDEFNGDTYGESHSFNEVTGDFRRDVRGRIRIIQGPPMVAEHLVRVLKTPVGTTDRVRSGSDPIRPNHGLDRQRLLGQVGNSPKQAIIDAIGPGAIPWVEDMGLDDVVINRVDGSRRATISITAHLADGTVSQFGVGFDELLRPDTATQVADDSTEEYQYQYPGDQRTGFGYDWGTDFGE